MISKVKTVNVIYPENNEELQRRYVKALAKIIIKRTSAEKIDALLEELKKEQ